MKLGDPFPSATAFKTLLCSVSNKGRLQKLICSYLTDLAQNVDVEIVYSVGSRCTNLSSQQPMQDYSFDQSEADTILFSAYTLLRKSVALLSLMRLILMHMLRQQLFHSSFPVCCVSRESRRLSSVVGW